MFFIAHINVIDSELETERILVDADTYAEAVGKIETFCGDALESVTLIEPITGSSVLLLDEVAEEHIRGNPFNGF